MSDYPGQIDSFVNPTDSDTLDDPPHDAQHADVNNAIVAVQNELGINPRGSFASVRQRLDEEISGLREVVVFTADGSFNKADYPWLRAVRVWVVGGGGGGGGAEQTSGSQASAGAGGGGGGYAESLIPAADLSSSVAVTVGAAGSTTSGGAGGDGGTSSFGELVEAPGGNGGEVASASSATNVNGSLSNSSPFAGDIQRRGDPGDEGFGTESPRNVKGGAGGSSPLGSGGRANMTTSVGSSGFGAPSPGFGGGGGGGARVGSVGSSVSGGSAHPGAVIVEMYA